MIKKMYMIVVILTSYFIGDKSQASSYIPKINVAQHNVLIDEPLEIIISNLIPKKNIIIQASFRNATNDSFQSSATFITDDSGVVNVATQPAISGSYQGIDPMGLFWSMLPIEKKIPQLSRSNLEGLEILLQVLLDGEVKADQIISLLFANSEITKKVVNEEGLSGVIFYPKNKEVMPGVVVLHGSSGIIPDTIAMFIASHGYSAFALGYFGVDSMPAELANINLEYFQQALRYLKNQPQVKKDCLGLIGVSRGGEAALLVASTFPEEIKAIVTFVPSSVINGGVPYSNTPAWIHKNLPLTPFMPALTNNQIQISFVEDLGCAIKSNIVPFHKGTAEDPYESLSLCLARIEKYHEMLETAAIPVENIQCPLLIFSGESDLLWPSSFYGDQIMERLEKTKSTIYKQHIRFSNAGHVFFMLPNQPVFGSQSGYHRIHKNWLSYGGTSAGNALASKESWRQTLRFLNDHLK